MCKHTIKNMNYFRLLGTLLVMLAVATTQIGCKEATSKSAPNAPGEPKNVQTQSQPPAEIENPTSDNVPESPTAPPAENKQTVATDRNKKNLIDIIRTARGWGPAREYIPVIGKEAPDFTLTDINGKEHKLSDHKGKNVILVFWATWCGPCKMAVPHLMELRKTVSEDKLAIMALSYVSSYPPNTAKMIKDFADAKELNYTVLPVGSDGAGTLYDSVNSLPTVFFIDTEGKMKIATSGLMPLDDFKAILEGDWPEGTFEQAGG